MAGAFIKRENAKRVNEGKALLPQPKRRAKAGMKIDYFDGRKDPLSNNYRYMIQYEKKKFATVSHAYYCAKAKMYGEMVYYRQIKDSFAGYPVMYLGRKVRVDDRWAKCRVNIMREILRAKMEQCANYRKRLAECSGMIVAVFHDDDFWYSGVKKDAVLMDGECPGQNMLGLLHTEIRNELKDRDEFPESTLAKEYDSLATATAASGELECDKPPAKRQKLDDTATQAVNEVLTSKGSNLTSDGESMGTHHSDDSGYSSGDGEAIPVLTPKVPCQLPQGSSTSSKPPQRPTTLALGTSPPSANQGKCIWCLTVRALLPGKRFCAECSAQGCECVYCHRPMPERFFTYSERLCNACFKKDAKQKAKRRIRSNGKGL